MAMWDKCAAKIFKELETETNESDGSNKSISNALTSSPSSKKFDSSEYEPENVDVLGDYTRMNSPGLIHMYSKKIKNAIVGQIPYYKQKLTNDMIMALTQAICFQVYAHETFHFYIDALHKIFNFNFSSVEESLATAFEYRLLFCEDIRSYKFNKDLTIINNIFSSYQETTIDDMFDISPMYDWDNTQKNGDVFCSMKKFINRYGQEYEKLNYLNIKLPFYKDWNKYYKHESFLYGVYNYVEDEKLKEIKKNNIINVEYLILGGIKSMFMLKKVEIIK